MGWRHDHDRGRSLRRINARKEGQQISQCFTGTRLRSQIRVLPGSERWNCGDLNGAGVGDLLLRERSYEFRWHRQIGKLHEIELATLASSTCLSRGITGHRFDRESPRSAVVREREPKPQGPFLKEV